MPELFEARKTLLVGLGSTGNQILRKLRDKIRWEFTDPDALKWIRYLGIETHTATRELAPADTEYITLGSSEYQTILQKPADYQSRLALEDWLDIGRVRRAGMSVVDTGAGNNRMIGRLAFLFERNFNRVRDGVRQRLNGLNTLRDTDAASTLSDSLNGAAWQVHFDRGQDGDDIDIVTVGTLCGGTCSGLFLDFGYLLRRLTAELNLHTESRAIFTLPNAGVANAVHAANSYAALIELDYYSDPVNVYHAKYPDLNSETLHTGHTPFDRLFLAEATGISATDTDRLNEIIAHYLYSRLMFRPVREKTDGKAIDAVADHFEQVSLCGAPQRYFTFGLASLEYPTTQIRRACSARIVADALGAWLAPQPGAADATWLREIGVEEGVLSGRLLEAAGGSIADQVNQAVRSSCRRGERAPAKLQELEMGLPELFESASPGKEGLSGVETGIVRKTVAGGVLTQLDSIRAAWKVRVQEQLSGRLGGDITGMLSRLVGETESASAWLKQEAARITAKLAAQAQSSAADDLLTRMKKERSTASAYGHDTLLTVALWKDAAVRRQVRRVEKLALSYAEERRRSVLERYGLLPLYTELQAFAGRLLVRLKSELNGAAVQPTVQRMQAHFSRQYESLAGTAPLTPGRVVFTPREKDDRGNNTVDVALDTTLRELPSRDGSLKGAPPAEVRKRLYGQLVNRWMDAQKLVEELFREPASYWDPVRGEEQQKLRSEVDSRDAAALELEASGFFGALLSKSVVDEVGAREIGTSLRAVGQDARLQLALNLGDPCYSQAANKNWKFLFHPPTGTVPEVQERLADALPELGIMDTAGGSTEFADLRRIMLLQEQCAFPLSSLESIGRLEDQYQRRKSEGNDPHARADVHWIGIIKAPEDRANIERARHLFVTAVGLGVVKFVGLGAARPFEFTFAPPIGPSRTESFDRDLRKTALDLHLDQRVSAVMRQQVTEQLTEIGPAGAAARLKRFIEETGAPDDLAARRAFAPPEPLEIAGHQISASELYGAVEAYLVDNEPAACRQLRESLVNVDVRAYRALKEGELFLDGSAAPLSGYYCTCKQRLAPLDQEQNVPDSCPRCKRPLRVRNL